VSETRDEVGLSPFGEGESPPEPGLARREAQLTRGNAEPGTPAGGSAARRTHADAAKEGVHGGTRGSPTRERVAAACRILAAEGYADLTLGHVSARGAEGDIWIKRKGVALDEVEPDDVVALDDTDAVLHLETVLHTSVYRVRPDVGAVVHGHPPYATALSATSSPLKLLTHDSVLFADGVGRFDEPHLIVDEDQGGRVAEALGRRRAVLLRNHGVVVVGKDVPWAVLTAATLERAARLQAVASTLGALRPIGDELARELLPLKYRDEFVDEYWAAWQRQLARDGGGPGGARR
jgi:L-fuculose-phosphate aldolase